MNIYHSNTYGKDLSWLHFNDEPRIQEKAASEYPAYLFFQLLQQFQVATKSTSPDMTTIFHAWLYGRFIEIQSNLWRTKLHRMSQGSNFLGDSFSNRDNIRAPIQFSRERVNLNIVKDYFSSRANPSIFTLIAPVLLDQSNKIS